MKFPKMITIVIALIFLGFYSNAEARDITGPHGTDSDNGGIWIYYHDKDLDSLDFDVWGAGWMNTETNHGTDAKGNPVTVETWDCSGVGQDCWFTDGGTYTSWDLKSTTTEGKLQEISNYLAAHPELVNIDNYLSQLNEKLIQMGKQPVKNHGNWTANIYPQTDPKLTPVFVP